MSREGDVIDVLLGEASAEIQERVRVAARSDLAAAAELAETLDLFERMRSLSPAATGCVPLAVRYAIHRRLELRAPRIVHLRDQVVLALRIAVVAVLWLFASDALFGPRPPRDDASRDRQPIPAAPLPAVASVDLELETLLDADRLPVADESFARHVRHFASLPIPDSYGGWLSADNLLARLREEFGLRFSPRARHVARVVTGSPDLEDRIDELAKTIAWRIEAQVAAGDASVQDTVLAMRALMAVGSTTEVGPYRDVVHACLAHLSRRLDGLGDGELATALSALADLAVASGGHLSALVAQQADRLARSTLRPDGSQRPALLHWKTPAASLADAGRVFQIAPAFGVHAGLAFRARLMVAAHLAERLAHREQEQHPALVAAQLYGFGDLIDRDAADRRLALWHPKLLLPDYVALHHLAWSKYPVRAGWASFQKELRGLAGLPTPAGTGDAAALLLCLSVNSAAPGTFEVRRLFQS